MSVPITAVVIRSRAWVQRPYRHSQESDSYVRQVRRCPLPLGPARAAPAAARAGDAGRPGHADGVAWLDMCEPVPPTLAPSAAEATATAAAPDRGLPPLAEPAVTAVSDSLSVFDFQRCVDLAASPAHGGEELSGVLWRVRWCSARQLHPQRLRVALAAISQIAPYCTGHLYLATHPRMVLRCDGSAGARWQLQSCVAVPCAVSRLDLAGASDGWPQIRDCLTWAERGDGERDLPAAAVSEPSGGAWADRQGQL